MLKYILFIVLVFGGGSAMLAAEALGLLPEWAKAAFFVEFFGYLTLVSVAYEWPMSWRQILDEISPLLGMIFINGFLIIVFSDYPRWTLYAFCLTMAPLSFWVSYNRESHYSHKKKKDKLTQG